MPVGFQELVVLFVIGLLILGPERLPRVATQIGRWVGKARRTANQLRYQLEREMALADIEEKKKKREKEQENEQAGEPVSGNSAAAPGATVHGKSDPAPVGDDSERASDDVAEDDAAKAPPEGDDKG